MAYTHDEKSSGQLIRSADWNNMGREVMRLETDKLNRAGDKISGDLTVTGKFNGVGDGKFDASLSVGGALNVTGNLGIGVTNASVKLEVAGNIKFNDTLSSPGRMHISGEENLFLLNKGGVIIGKEWGGNGNLQVQGNLNFGAQVRQMVNLWNADYGIGVQSSTQYFRTGKNFAWYKLGSHNDGELNAGGGTVQMVLKDGSLGIGTDPGVYKLNVAGPVSLGGFTGGEGEEWPNLVWYRDTATNWDEGLIKHGPTKGKFGRSGFGIHMHQSRDFGFFSTGWDTLFAVAGQSGNTFIKGNLGVGVDSPKAKLEVNGAVNFHNSSPYAVPNGSMAAGSLTIGGINTNYGGGTGWNANTAGLMLETQANTEIAVHDSGGRLASLMFFEGDSANRITIGRDMGWGALGELTVKSRVMLGTSDIYFTDINHNHSGIGNTPGYAAIENAVNYDALMIMGRAHAGGIRTVKLWDFLEVNGTLKTNKLRLGDKWVLSGVGDYHGNDEWLRLHGLRESNQGNANYWPNNNTSGEYSGFAVGKLWAINNSVQGSDMRMKEDINTLEHPIEDLLSLRGVRFKWQQGGAEGKTQIGLIAQEVEQVFPEVVETGPDGMMGINYSALVAPLIEAVKQQQAQINALTTEVQALKGI